MCVWGVAVAATATAHFIICLATNAWQQCCAQQTFDSNVASQPSKRLTNNLHTHTHTHKGKDNEQKWKIQTGSNWVVVLLSAIVTFER